MKKAPVVNTKPKAGAGPVIQTKLEIGKPNDKHEQQADAVADQVMKMPADEEKVSMSAMDEESVQMQPEGDDQVQMQPEEESSVQMQPDEEKVAMTEDEEVAMQKDEEVSMKEDEEIQKKSLIQRSEGGQSVATPALANQLSSSKGGGRSLPGDVNKEMSQKIGSDFSNVRVHTDSKAAEMNEGLGAKAFAHGNDVYFNKGNFNPGQPEGKKLLAHELTHVVQQKGKIQPKIQKQEEEGISQRQLRRHFDARIADNEVISFTTTAAEPVVVIKLTYEPILCKIDESECETAIPYSFDTTVEDAEHLPFRVIQMDEENPMQLHHITQEYVMNGPGEHTFKIELQEPSPCGENFRQLYFKAEFYGKAR